MVDEFTKYSMSVRSFFDIKDEAKRMCFDQTPNSPCVRGINDVSSRILFGIGNEKRAFQSGKNTGKEIRFLDPSIGFNETFSFSQNELHNSILNAHKKICSPLARNTKKLSKDILKETQIENYTQCLKGIGNFVDNVERFKNNDNAIHELF